jgi:hypothetical protein
MHDTHIHAHTHMPMRIPVHGASVRPLCTWRPYACGVPMRVPVHGASVRPLCTWRLCVRCARESLCTWRPYAHPCTRGICASLVHVGWRLCVPCVPVCTSLLSLLRLCYVSVAVPVASFLVHMGVLWVVHIGPLCTCEIINI